MMIMMPETGSREDGVIEGAKVESEAIDYVRTLGNNGEADRFKKGLRDRRIVISTHSFRIKHKSLHTHCSHMCPSLVLRTLLSSRSTMIRSPSDSVAMPA